MKLDRHTYIELVKNVPLVAIDLLIKNSEHSVLLGLRNNEPSKDSWFVPGGRIYKNERIMKAFERLSKEELGVKLGFLTAQFLGVFEHLYRENSFQQTGFGTHYVTLAFQVNLLQSLHFSPEAQHRQLKWWTVENLLKARDVHPYTKAYFRPTT